eukprot:CAMPEP_0178998452 /NCGR_PEP_ID=MMETSP0795-20121207/9519_1 /TAXON_ID=88552 /ORGANISM="Amoebophrya sp., Strain Ameob2" /LENGTH=2216 /DNA_ID=CAMNT_0020691129 /DNA_START=249 /DNA_END=6899 /DNA_ORIENTATION=+
MSMWTAPAPSSTWSGPPLGPGARQHPTTGPETLPSTPSSSFAVGDLVWIAEPLQGYVPAKVVYADGNSVKVENEVEGENHNRDRASSTSASKAYLVKAGTRIFPRSADEQLAGGKALSTRGGSSSSTFRHSSGGGGRLSGSFGQQPRHSGPSPFRTLMNQSKQVGKPDCTSLTFLDEANILDNVRRRYQEDQIYTFTGAVLFAVNPYKPVYLDTDQKRLEYKHLTSIHAKPPHPYALADLAYRQLLCDKESQAMVISGESGAGKTETAKIVMKFLGERSRTEQSQAASVQENILSAASPLLESFGNATTIRNGNSSRFGKYNNLCFNPVGSLVGAEVRTYLLEKSRVLNSCPDERTYHVFYEMFAGSKDLNEFFLRPTQSYKLLQTRAASREDAENFRVLEKGLEFINLKESAGDVFALLAALIHLGECEFVGEWEMPQLNNSEEFTYACDLAGFDDRNLVDSLTILSNVIARRDKDSFVVQRLNRDQANGALQSLIKILYARLFDFIVEKVNKAMEIGEEHRNYIGILDIYGFECLQTNSLEQLCINLANERLQQFFVEKVLVAEQDWYQREGLQWTAIPLPDAEPVLTDIKFVLGSLDDYNKQAAKGLQAATDEKFCESLHNARRTNVKEPFIGRKSKRKLALAKNAGFVINHYAGEVEYETWNWIEKNNTSLKQATEQAIRASVSPLVKQLADENACQLVPDVAPSATTIGKKYVTNLEQLMSTLEGCSLHYIRCFKPNAEQLPGKFNGQIVLDQMIQSGTIELVRMMHDGYPNRVPFGDLMQRFLPLLPPEFQGLDARMFVEALMVAFEVPKSEWTTGTTRLFLKAGRMAVLEALRANGASADGAVLAKLRKTVWKKKLRRCLWAVRFTLYVKSLMKDVRQRALVTGLARAAHNYVRLRRWLLRARFYIKERRKDSLAKKIRYVLRVAHGLDAWLCRVRYRLRARWLLRHLWRMLLLHVYGRRFIKRVRANLQVRVRKRRAAFWLLEFKRICYLKIFIREQRRRWGAIREERAAQLAEEQRLREEEQRRLEEEQRRAEEERALAEKRRQEVELDWQRSVEDQAETLLARAHHSAELQREAGRRRSLEQQERDIWDDEEYAADTEIREIRQRKSDAAFLKHRKAVDRTLKAFLLCASLKVLVIRRRKKRALRTPNLSLIEGSFSPVLKGLGSSRSSRRGGACSPIALDDDNGLNSTLGGVPAEELQRILQDVEAGGRSKRAVDHAENNQKQVDDESLLIEPPASINQSDLNLNLKSSAGVAPSSAAAAAIDPTSSSASSAARSADPAPASASVSAASSTTKPGSSSLFGFGGGKPNFTTSAATAAASLSDGSVGSKQLPQQSSSGDAARQPATTASNKTVASTAFRKPATSNNPNLPGRKVSPSSVSRKAADQRVRMEALSQPRQLNPSTLAKRFQADSHDEAPNLLGKAAGNAWNKIPAPKLTSTASSGFGRGPSAGSQGRNRSRSADFRSGAGGVGRSGSHPRERSISNDWGPRAGGAGRNSQQQNRSVSAGRSRSASAPRSLSARRTGAGGGSSDYHDKPMFRGTSPSSRVLLGKSDLGVQRQRSQSPGRFNENTRTSGAGRGRPGQNASNDTHQQPAGMRVSSGLVQSVHSDLMTRGVSPSARPSGGASSHFDAGIIGGLAANAQASSSALSGVVDESEYPAGSALPLSSQQEGYPSSGDHGATANNNATERRRSQESESAAPGDQSARGTSGSTFAAAFADFLKPDVESRPMKSSTTTGGGGGGGDKAAAALPAAGRTTGMLNFRVGGSPRAGAARTGGGPGASESATSGTGNKKTFAPSSRTMQHDSSLSKINNFSTTYTNGRQDLNTSFSRTQPTNKNLFQGGAPSGSNHRAGTSFANNKSRNAPAQLNRSGSGLLNTSRGLGFGTSGAADPHQRPASPRVNPKYVRQVSSRIDTGLRPNKKTTYDPQQPAGIRSDRPRPAIEPVYHQNTEAVHGHGQLYHAGAGFAAGGAATSSSHQNFRSRSASRDRDFRSTSRPRSGSGNNIFPPPERGPSGQLPGQHAGGPASSHSNSNFAGFRGTAGNHQQQHHSTSRPRSASRDRDFRPNSRQGSLDREKRSLDRENRDPNAGRGSHGLANAGGAAAGAGSWNKTMTYQQYASSTNKNRNTNANRIVTTPRAGYQGNVPAGATVAKKSMNPTPTSYASNKTGGFNRDEAYPMSKLRQPRLRSTSRSRNSGGPDGDGGMRH